MRYEIDFFGVLGPTLLLWLLATSALCAMLRPAFRRAGLYRFYGIARCSTCLFVCVLGASFTCPQFLS
jgi:hypothetical protein